MALTQPRLWAAHPLLLFALKNVLIALLAALVGYVLFGVAGLTLAALTLAQSAEMSTNLLRRGVIETFIDSSPVLARIPFMEIEGNAYQYGSESALPGVAFRAVNAAYTESTGAIVNATEGLKIMGGDADVDRFLQKTRSNRMDLLDFQTRLKSKAAAIKFTETFFEGDDSIVVDEFDGLRTRLTGTQVILAGTNGAALTLNMVDDMLALVDGADVIFTNDWLIRKINGLVRTAGGIVPEPREQFGRRWYSYAGIDMVDAGKALNGTSDILGFDETAGSSSLTASIYAVKWGEDEYLAGLTNGGIDVYPIGELETKPAFRTRVEWYVGLAMFRSRAAARIRGVLQA